jgi:hypothetical protein
MAADPADLPVEPAGEPEEIDLDADDLDDDDLDEDIDEEVLDDDEDDELDPDAVEDIEVVEADEVDVDVVEPDVEPAGVVAPAKGRADDDDEEEDDELDPDDVEADLDTILKDRIAAAADEEDDEEAELGDPEVATDGTKIPPRRPGEFVCQSCFLVKNGNQLADADSRLCVDCV